MNGGLNVSPAAMRPPPWHIPGSTDLRVDCSCAVRVRGGSKRFVEPGDVVRLYTGGQAVSVDIEDPYNEAPFEGSGGEITPDDVSLVSFVSQGNAFVYIDGGRDEQVFAPTFFVTTTNDIKEVDTLMEIRK